MRSRPGRPEALFPFEQLLGGEIAPQQTAGGLPAVGQICKFVPEELALAAGVLPLRVDCGHADAETVGEKLLPAEVCCAAKAFLGAWQERLLPWLEQLELLAVPACCEAKKKLAALLSPSEKIFLLELPPRSDSDEGRRWWYRRLEELCGRLQKIGGQKIGRFSLRRAIEAVNRRCRAARRLAELQSGERPALGAADYLLALQASFLAHPLWYAEKLEQLIDEIEKRPATAGAPGRGRVVLSGSPLFWPDFELALLLDECGAELVADDLCSGTEFLRHPAVVDEWTGTGMFRAVAERVLLPCTCPSLLGNDTRAERLGELVRAGRAGGVVHHTLRLCVPYDMDEDSLARRFRSAGTAWLSLRSQLGSQDELRSKSRLQAFLDLLQQSEPPAG